MPRNSERIKQPVAFKTILKKIEVSESQTVSALLSYLSLKGYFCWRQNNNGVFDVKKRIFRRNGKTLRGLPDIFAMKSNGVGAVIYAIEAKSRRGYQTPHQKSFQIKFEENGGIYILARSVGDLIEGGL